MTEIQVPLTVRDLQSINGGLDYFIDSFLTDIEELQSDEGLRLAYETDGSLDRSAADVLRMKKAVSELEKLQKRVCSYFPNTRQKTNRIITPYIELPKSLKECLYLMVTAEQMQNDHSSEWELVENDNGDWVEENESEREGRLICQYKSNAWDFNRYCTTNNLDHKISDYLEDGVAYKSEIADIAWGEN